MLDTHFARESQWPPGEAAARNPWVFREWTMPSRSASVSREEGGV